MITFIAMLLASNRSRATDARAKDRAGSPLDVARRLRCPSVGGNGCARKRRTFGL